MIYLKNIDKKFDKYFKDKREENIKLKTNILKMLFEIAFQKTLKTIKKLLKNIVY